MKKFISAIIAFFLISLLSLYIANFREGNYFPVWIFWFCLIAIFFLIVYQIAKIEKQISNYYIFILLQILMTAFLVRMLFISTGNALAGNDAYNELVLLLKVNNMGYWNPYDIGGYSIAYPILYIFGIIWSQIIGVNLFTTAKWMPISLFFVAPLFIYLICNLKYSKKAALLASFGFAFLYISLFFHTTFVKEVIALPLFLITIYTYYASIPKGKRIGYLLIAFLFSACCVLAHYLTSFILLIFFTTFLIIDRFASSKKDIKEKSVRISRYLTVNKEFVSTTFVMFLFTFLLGYWVYLRYTPLQTPLQTFALIYKELATNKPRAGMILPNILRYKILWWGEIVFAILFGFLSIFGVFLKKEKRNSSDVTLSLFSGLMGIIMVLTLFGRVISGEGMGLGSRFQTFVYIGLFILSGHTAHNILKMYRGKLKNALPLMMLIIFVAFALLSIYRIPPYLYSEKIEFNPEETRSLITEDELTAINWLGTRNVKLDASLASVVFRLNKTQDNKYGVECSKITYIIHTYIAPFSTNKYILENGSSFKFYNNGLVDIYFIKNKEL